MTSQRIKYIHGRFTILHKFGAQEVWQRKERGQEGEVKQTGSPLSGTIPYAITKKGCKIHLKCAREVNLSWRFSFFSSPFWKQNKRKIINKIAMTFYNSMQDSNLS